MHVTWEVLPAQHYTRTNARYIGGGPEKGAPWMPRPFIGSSENAHTFIGGGGGGGGGGLIGGCGQNKRNTGARSPYRFKG